LHGVLIVGVPAGRASAVELLVEACDEIKGYAPSLEAIQGRPDRRLLGGA
jgi:hypothetical protein